MSQIGKYKYLYKDQSILSEGWYESKLQENQTDAV